jgi:hypothetical protein
MGGRNRQSRDQKRKAKLAERAKRHAPSGPEPYEGTKYQAEGWTPHVYRTELPVYEAIVLSQRRLTNEQVREAFVRLIAHLRAGEHALLPEDAPEVPFAPGGEVEFLIWNIRRHWRELVKEQGPVATADLIGILRTLLHSIEAHAWNTGPEHGYVAFLYDFLRRMPR